MKANTKKINSYQIMYASEVEEFFWEDSGISVSEGIVVGVEQENGSNIDLVLFEDIYWSDENL